MPTRVFVASLFDAGCCCGALLHAEIKPAHTTTSGSVTNDRTTNSQSPWTADGPRRYIIACGGDAIPASVHLPWPGRQRFPRPHSCRNVTHEGYVYAGANHGFHNDTTPRYDEAAATLAWQRTLEWFNKYLR